ncbi:MAG: hypothetical protein COA94_05550 [Rickettsiales bacterium]|nr:MAG: hypothetical protein COA94_05550 [Rickettsiales bacterium]
MKLKNCISILGVSALSSSVALGGVSIVGGTAYVTGSYSGTIVDPTIYNSLNVDIDNTSSPILNNDVTGGDVDVRGSSSPIFQETVNGDYVNIRDDSTPTFEKSVTTSSPYFVAVRDNSSPIFKGDVYSNHDLSINGTSTPNFMAKTESGRYVYVFGNATAAFTGDVTANYGLSLRENATGTFDGKVSSNYYLFIFDNSKSTFNGEVTTGDYISISGAAEPEFKNTLTSTGSYIKIADSAKPIFHDDVSVKGDVTISGTSESEFKKSITSTNGVILVQDDAKVIFYDVTSDGDITASGNSITEFNKATTGANSSLIVKDAAKATFHDDVVSDSNITISGTSESEFEKKLTSTSGTMDIQNDTKVTFHGDVLASGNVTISGTSESEFKQNLTSTAGSIFVQDDAKPIFNGSPSTTIAKGNSKPIFNAPASNVEIRENSEAIFNDPTGDIYISDTPTVTFKGTSSSKITLLHSASPNTPILKLEPGFTSSGDLIIDSIININLSEPTISGTVKLNKISMEADTKIKLDNDVTMDTPISTSVDKTGSLEFLGDAKILQDIGSKTNWLKNVTFDTNPADISLEGNIYANSVSFSGSNISFVNDRSITTGQSSLTYHDSSLDLDTKKLTVSGKTLFTGKTTFKTTFNVDGGGKETGGHIVVDGANSSFNFSGATPVEIILTADSPLSPTDTYSYKLLIEENGGTIIPANNITFTPNENNSLITWTYDEATHTLNAKNNPAQLPVIVAKTGGSEDDVKVAATLASANSSNICDATNVVMSNIGRLKEAQMLEAVQRVQTTPGLGARATEISSAILNELEARITSLVTGNQFADAGVAAGDSNNKYGVWANGFYGRGYQGRLPHSPKYNSRLYGLTIGADAPINDDVIYGLSMTSVRSTTKFSDKKANDVVKVKSLVFSFYAHRDLGRNWFSDVIFSSGVNRVKGMEKRVSFNNPNQLAVSKYKASTYSGQLMLGYNHHTKDNVIITPFGSLGYSWVDKIKYTETGAGAQNLSVQSGSSYVLEASFGGDVAFQTLIKGVPVTPEIHAYISYNFKVKRPTVIAKLMGACTPIPARVAKGNKLFYNIGGEINAISESGSIEYGLNYEIKLSKKYINQVGGLKLRVNF